MWLHGSALTVSVAHERDTRINGHLRDRISAYSTKLDFQEFLDTLDLQQVVKEYRKGSFVLLMDRLISMELDS